MDLLECARQCAQTRSEDHQSPANANQATNAFLPHVAVLEFPDDAAAHYAQIRADLKRRGQMIGANELFIAAHARSLGLRLVTNNIAEFNRVKGLTLENWTTRPVRRTARQTTHSRWRGYAQCPQRQQALALTAASLRHAHHSIHARPFTARQGHYLAFIYYYTKIHGTPPADGRFSAVLSRDAACRTPDDQDAPRTRIHRTRTWQGALCQASSHTSSIARPGMTSAAGTTASTSLAEDRSWVNSPTSG